MYVFTLLLASAQFAVKSDWRL